MNGRFNFAQRGAFALVASAVGLVAAASCTQDFDQFFQGTTTTTPTDTGTGGTGGSPGECSEPADCEGTDTTCQQRTCTNHICGTNLAAEGTACTEDGGAVCDADGNCVECLDESQCGDQEVCDENSCVPEACVNDTLDGEETDVDCGGPDCNPCPNGDDCLLARDCESRFCDSGSGAGGGGGAGGAAPASGECAPCVTDGDCSGATNTWCDANTDGGACVDQLDDGEDCSSGNQCVSGFCPAGDAVCCNVLCQGTCQACLQSKTGSPDGTCAFVTAGTDPDTECTAEAPSTCGASGNGCSGTAAQCVLYDNTTVCATETCVGNILYSDRLCDGGGICTTPTSGPCPNGYLCNSAGDACLTSCTGHGDCLSSYWCDGTDDTCQPDKADGEACTSFLECQSNSCPSPDGVCCDATCNRDCESCLNADHGGGDGNCLPIPAGTADPTGACGGYQAPCGGQVCNGNASSPACESPCPSCADLYGGQTATNTICNNLFDECRVNMDNTSISCEDFCQLGGGECLDYRNDNPNDSCGLAGTAEGCNDTGTHVYGICTCSHGCGLNPPCGAGETCSSGSCI